MDEEYKILNSITILSFDIYNKYFSLKSETLFFDNKIWGELPELTQTNKINNEDILTNQEEYWIIEKNGINKIFIKNNQTENEFNTNRIKAGPFFNINSVTSYLNILNDVGF